MTTQAHDDKTSYELKEVTGRVFYHSDWNILALEFILDDFSVLIPDELYERNNVYRALTNDWDYVGEL